jgi:hypothetical protein
MRTRNSEIVGVLTRLKQTSENPFRFFCFGFLCVKLSRFFAIKMKRRKNKILSLETAVRKSLHKLKTESQ